MPLTYEQKRGIVRAIAMRCHTGHCWVRTVDGPRRVAREFGEVQLSEHTAGTTVYGLCPIAPGEMTTRVALLDLDSHNGETPWPSMLRVADSLRLRMELDGHNPRAFRSSGGAGIHIALIWESPADAYSVRVYLRMLLEDCGLAPGTGGVAKGEIEVYPKQDFVRPDGYGSMFILPLGGGTRSELLD